MNNKGGIGVLTGLLTVAFMVGTISIGPVIGNIMNEVAVDYGNELKTTTDDVLEDVTTYIFIDEIYGKYGYLNGIERINKIAIFVRNIMPKNIELSYLVIQIDNGIDIQALTYYEEAQFLGNNEVFNHPLWDNIDENSFSFISTKDKDESLVQENVFNTEDMGYFIFKIPEDINLCTGDYMTITLIPETGQSRKITIKAPISTNQLIMFLS